MKFTRLLIPGLFAGAALAQIPGTTLCTTSASSEPVLSVFATAAAVGDYLLACVNTGFAPGSPTGTVQFDFFANTNILTPGSWNLVENATNHSPALVVGNHIQFTGVVYDPNLATVNFDLQGIDVNPSLLPPSFVYQESLSISGTISVPLTNAVVDVAINGAAPEPTSLLLTATAGISLLLRRRSVVRASSPARSSQAPFLKPRRARPAFNDLRTSRTTASAAANRV